MNVTEDPSYCGQHVKVDYDLDAGEIIATLPEYTEPDGDTVAATVLAMSPAEAVELAGGIIAVSVSAAAHLLAKRQAGPVERVTDAGTQG